MTDGWIKLHRSMQDHWLWKDKPYDQARAWIDLIMLANYEDKKMDYKGEIITCKRGDVNLSISYLASRWKWDRKTVKRFLDLLEMDGMCTTECTTHRTTITIVNYGFYQGDGTTERATEWTAKSQQDGQQSPTTKKDKKDKNNISTKVDISKSSSIDYQGVVDKYNSICVSFKKVNKLSEDRKKVIKARLNTYTVDDLVAAFQKAESSDFLKGKNDKNWMADFDWMLKDRNLAKILDGNYDNKPGFKKATKNSFNDFSLRQNYEGLDLEHWGE